MDPEPVPNSRYADVDIALRMWRQGDCVLGEQWFVHRLDPSFPVTDSGQIAASAGEDLADEQVVGLIVVSQTCDIVRPCSSRQYIEVSPLVEVDEVMLREIERGRRPAYGYIALLAQCKLVADLDRTMTVEKPVVAKWKRTPGWETDEQGRSFADALARKRRRFPFPDDFTEFAKKLRNRLAGKHDRESPEGRALQALQEIRVQAAPTWYDPKVSLTFWFIRGNGDADFEGKGWPAYLDSWLQLVPASERFAEVHGLVTTLDDLTAVEYVGSDRLDLDYLSTSSAGGPT